MNTLQIYETDVGTVILPPDFPAKAYRKNGKPDRRRKEFAALSEFEDCLKEAAMQVYLSGGDINGSRTITWAEWLKKTNV